MEFSGTELRDIYEAIIKPIPHPDRVGYLTRVLLLSGGDPDYVSLDGLIGFMPVDPKIAFDMVGANNISDLNGNILATMAMDNMFFSESMSIDEMIRMFHFGNADKTSEEQNTFIDSVSNGRSDTLKIMYPRMATVKDVIRMIKGSINTSSISSDETEFFNFLLSGNASDA